MPKDSTVADLDELLRQARTARSRLEPGWFLDLAYYIGEQWLAWNGNTLFKPQMPKNRITIVDNRIQPCIRKEIARLTKNRPVMVVTPNSPDEEDGNASRLGDQVMQYLWEHLNLNKLRRKALEWSRICGAGFIKPYWDSTIGPQVDVLLGPDGRVLTTPDGAPVQKDSPEAMLAMQMNPQVRVKTVAQGDIKVEVRSPFQMFTDPLADTFEDVEWVIEESIKSRDYVQRRYNVDIQPDTPANIGLVEARMGATLSPGGGAYKGIRVREYWCKPCPTHPRGYRAVWATAQGERDRNQQSSMLLEDDRPFDPMPYVMFSAIPVPGRLWPQSIVDPLRGPQTELNKVKSQIAENRNRLGNPTLLASKQATQDPDKLIESTSLPGGVCFYDSGYGPDAVPRYLEAPPLPEYVINEIQEIQASIQEISGQHEVTSAQVPPGVTSGAAIQLLQEADDTMIAPDVDDHEEGLGKLGQKLLRLVGQYYTDARTVQIGGDNGAWQIFDFRGSQLRGNVHVKVQAGSAFPQSKAGKQAQMQDFLTYSAQTGQPLQGRELAKFMEAWGLGGLTGFVQAHTIDETQCNRENALLAQGQPIPINSFDDDTTHIANHTDFQKQPHYPQLPPQIQALIEQHVNQHRQRLSSQQQAQLQMQLEMEGKIPPTLSAPALAASQQLSQLQEVQGQQQQMQMDQAQGQQQMDLKGAQHAQQQGFSQASLEQQQRHAEQLHSQKMQHTQELHELRLKQQSQQQRQGDRSAR